MWQLSLQSSRILVVDDDEPSIRLVTKMLTSLGASAVATACSGIEALAALQTALRPFDCVLCDIWMPNGNGLQLLKAIRCGEIKTARPDTCFIFITALSGSTPVRSATQLDASGYLVKPITLESLHTAITRGKTKSFPLDFVRYKQTPVPEGAL